MLDRPDEADEVESLSCRMAAERYPDQDYEENRAWHHRPVIQRVNGKLVPLTMSIRFPATDLPGVVARLRAAAREIDGRTVSQSPDEDRNQDESNTNA